MTDPKSPQGEDMAFLIADLIDKADQHRADQLRKQAERDALWRKRIRAATCTTMAIGAMADHLEQRLPETNELRIAATWIVQYAERLEGLLLAMISEGIEDD